MDKGLAPPTLHDLEGLPNGQGLDPPNPSRLGVAPKWTRVGPPQIGLDPPTLHDLAGVTFQEADSFCYQILLI